MTRLLFRENPRATTFSARVEEVDGARVRLDRTLFYPEGGGQSPDLGTLAWEGHTAQVSDVQKGAGGAVWHTLEGGLPGLGQAVEGEIDWRTRYRHMQRHSAEHLLAQAYLRVNPAFRVRSVSMRSPLCTLDFEGEPTEADARAAETLLQGVIARDLPIEVFEVEDRELGNYPLRRPALVTGRVRLVGLREGEGWWELIACGGTHLPSTAFVAPMVVLGQERVRGLTRVSFMAGEEATEYLGEVYRAASGAARTLSVPVERLQERLEASLSEHEGLRRELEAALAGWAAALVGQATALAAPNGAALRVVELAHSGLVTPALKAAAGLSATVTAVVAPDGRCGVASGSPDLHAGELMRGWLAASGGRGGGKADLAQGQTSDPAAFLLAARSWASQR